MRYARSVKYALLIPVLAAAALSGPAAAQSATKPTNDAPNPYNTVSDYFKLPAGRTWGSTSAVEIDKDGKSIWVAERCGANSCLDRATGKMSADPTILKFDSTGKLVKSFGAGLLIFPHGIYVDRDGNVWVTDGQDNAPQPARGATAAARRPVRRRRRRRPRWDRCPAPRSAIRSTSSAPTARCCSRSASRAAPPSPTTSTSRTTSSSRRTATSSSAEGHGGANDRILKFSKDGKFIKSIGKKGSGPGEFNGPHALAFDSKGRLIVGDRSNNRIQILDQDGKFISETAEFGRPSGIWVDKNDVLYVADSESGSVNPNRPEWRRGIRIGKLSDGKVTAFIPDPGSAQRARSSAAPARPKASRSTRRATSTARKSDRKPSGSTPRNNWRVGELVNW